MESTTKQRILEAALTSFAENGYKGTNLRDLAAGLGLSKSALYKHYESKEKIWNAVIDYMEAYYAARFGSPENRPDAPVSADGLYDMTMRMLSFTMHDEKVILTRRLLLSEQFRDARARELATKHFLSGIQDIFTGVFREMMDVGILRRDDPTLLAFAYTAPISALVQRCDREPENAAAITGEIEAFVRWFIRTHTNENQQIVK